jgi:hypothetical protein
MRRWVTAAGVVLCCLGMSGCRSSGDPERTSPRADLPARDPPSDGRIGSAKGPTTEPCPDRIPAPDAPCEVGSKECHYDLCRGCRCGTKCAHYFCSCEGDRWSCDHAEALCGCDASGPDAS